MKEIGKMTKLMEMELIPMQMEQNTLEIGKMINKKGMVLKYGLMGLNMKVHISKERNKVKENSFGLMEANMTVILVIIILMVLAHIHGLMLELIKENGKITRWMDMENSHGPMEENISDIMLKIKSMDMVSSCGQMEDNIRECG